jgi:hypothetical protein
MTTKSTAVKNYIKDAGIKNQVFLFAGYDPNNAVSNSTQVATNTWNYADFSVRVGKQSLSAVIPYVKWIQSRPYNPWTSVEPNTGNFYAYNDQNGYVYLCISNNSSNRKDIGTNNVSSVRPTHTAGIQRYSDGYAWKPMYKITPSIERFVTSKWLPVVSFETFDNTPTQNQDKLTQAFCGSFILSTGNCAIYAKIPITITDESGSPVTFAKGDLYTTAQNISCYKCRYLMDNNPVFQSSFYDTTKTIPTSITIYDNYSLVGSLIASGEISQASSYYYLYDINENDELNEGSIVSAFIDLSGFNTNQLITTVQNPEFTITSNSGTGGRIRLLTSLINDNYVITGIEVISSGSYYKDITLDIDSSVISMDIDMLTSVITINLDTIDGLGFDPVDVLGAQHVMVDARLDKKTITDGGILLPENLNFFSMVENPTSQNTSGAQFISGSDQTVNSDIIYRTTIQAKVVNATQDLPDVGEYYSVPDLNTASSLEPSVITSPTTKDIIIGGIQSISATAANMEMKNVLYAKSAYLAGLTLNGSTNQTVRTNNVISQVLKKPEFVQYSGKPVITSKLNTALPISDTDSVIIRINMVKGM